MQTTGYTPKDIQEIQNMAINGNMAMADLFISNVKGTVKFITGKNYYYYNSDEKLWQMMQIAQFRTFAFRWFSETRKNCANMLRGLTDKGISKMLNDFENGGYIGGIIERALGDLLVPDFETKLDCKNDYLPILDGKKIHFGTLEITDRVAEDYFTFECPVSYTKKQKNAIRFFTDIMPNEEEREFLKKCLGYMITGRTDARKFFILYGMGSNGKSVVARLVEKIISKFYKSCGSQVFQKPPKMGATPEIAELLGKRLAIYAEGETADKMELNLSTIKQISGEDTINARMLYGNPVSFKANCKLAMTSNYIPPFGSDKAIKDRIVYLFFDQNFDKKPKKGEKKIDLEFIDSLMNKYLSEVFSWIIDGSKFYYESPSLEIPKEWLERRNTLLTEQDSISTFMDRFIKKTNNAKDKIRRSYLFELYSHFCNANSQRCQPRSTFFDRLRHEKISTVKLDGFDCFKFIVCKYRKDGIQDSDDEEEEEEEEKSEAIIYDGLHDSEKVKRLTKKMEEMFNQIEQLKTENETLKKLVKPKQQPEPEPEDIDDRDDSDNYVIKHNIFNRMKKSNMKVISKTDSKPSKSKKQEELPLSGASEVDDDDLRMLIG